MPDDATPDSKDEAPEENPRTADEVDAKIFKAERESGNESWRDRIAYREFEIGDLV